MNQLEMINELFVLKINFLTVAFTDFANDFESKNLAAWSVSSLIFLMFTINLFQIIKEYLKLI